MFALGPALGYVVRTRQFLIKLPEFFLLQIGSLILALNSHLQIWSPSELLVIQKILFLESTHNENTALKNIPIETSWDS